MSTINPDIAVNLLKNNGKVIVTKGFLDLIGASHLWNQCEDININQNENENPTV